MVDGSASKPALRQDTKYMVEKTYHDIAPYLGAFGGLFNASVTQIWLKRSCHIQKRSLERGGQLMFHLVKKPLVLVKNDPNRLYGLENLPFSSIFRPFWGLFNASGTQIGFKIGSHIAK